MSKPDYAAWAKAHPGLAAKVKEGQAGYDEISKMLDTQGMMEDTGRSEYAVTGILSPEGLETTYTPNGASGVFETESSSSLTGKVDQTADPEEPQVDPQQFLKANIGKLIVDDKDIPRGDALDEYLEKLEAGEYVPLDPYLN